AFAAKAACAAARRNTVRAGPLTSQGRTPGPAASHRSAAGQSGSAPLHRYEKNDWQPELDDLARQIGYLLHRVDLTAAASQRQVVQPGRGERKKHGEGQHNGCRPPRGKRGRDAGEVFAHHALPPKGYRFLRHASPTGVTHNSAMTRRTNTRNFFSA